MKITVQLILQGHPEMVEAVAERARQFLEVSEEGRDQHIPMRPGIIRRVLRVYPPQPSEAADTRETQAARGS